VGVLAVAGCYGLFFRLVRWRLSRHGAEVSRMGAERTAVAEQAFLGIKYLLIARAQKTFDQRFQAATRALSHSLAETNLIGQSPRYLLECVAGATLIACAAFVGGGATGSAWLAQLSFIAFAGFRLLPAAQQMYQASVVVRANRAVIDNLAAQLARRATLRDAEADAARPRAAPLRAVELVDLGFRYSAETPWVLDGASLRIEAGAAIGIVGASGCGKTTVVDLLTGLLARRAAASRSTVNRWTHRASRPGSGASVMCRRTC
jgi:HlyD family secretion protein